MKRRTFAFIFPFFFSFFLVLLLALSFCFLFFLAFFRGCEIGLDMPARIQLEVARNGSCVSRFLS